MDIRNKVFNEDCIEGTKLKIPDNSVDLIITDPPYGINGDKLHKHYNRKESFVIDGYTEIPESDYPEFSNNWIQQSERILKPGGSIYIVSGYTNLVHILNSLKNTKLKEMNHLIWKYNFGVYTKTKYVSSHYHILYLIKKGKKHTFNTNARYGQEEKNKDNGSMNYKDREDVWIINKEYKPGETKNKNELPIKLLTKIIQYSSNEGDLVFDFFLGGFSTAKVALGLSRDYSGFEINTKSFEHHYKELQNLEKGHLSHTLRIPQQDMLFSQGEPWNDTDLATLKDKYEKLIYKYKTKRKVIEELSLEFGRGRFSLTNALKRVGY
ncbi:MAG: site-specific DNA-methyltransferase [Candidatus Hinthialibacter antarcticus]|nr:site-specific DNA-methyltransferase [Candidatus Hinthialibacter antarcticus]